MKLGASLLLALACGKDDGEGGLGYAADFAGREGVYLELGPVEDPRDTPLILHVEDQQWVLRWGDEWGAATELATYDLSLNSGLTVGGFQLLPSRLAVGEVGDGVEVTARGEVEVWYGIFEDAVTVSVESGPFAGEQVFGRDLGPIRVTHLGAVWELAYYE